MYSERLFPFEPIWTYSKTMINGKFHATCIQVCTKRCAILSWSLHTCRDASLFWTGKCYILSNCQVHCVLAKPSTNPTQTLWQPLSCQSGQHGACWPSQWQINWTEGKQQTWELYSMGLAIQDHLLVRIYGIVTVVWIARSSSFHSMLWPWCSRGRGVWLGRSSALALNCWCTTEFSNIPCTLSLLCLSNSNCMS